MKFKVNTKETKIYDYFKNEVNNKFYLDGVPIFFNKNLMFIQEFSEDRMKTYFHIVGFESRSKKFSVCNDDEMILKHCPNKSTCGTNKSRHFCIYRAIYIKTLFFILNKLKNKDHSDLKAHEIKQQKLQKVELLYQTPNNNQNYLLVFNVDYKGGFKKYYLISAYKITTLKTNKFNQYYRKNKKII